MLSQLMSDVFILVMGVFLIGALIITAVGIGLFVVGLIRGRKIENFDEIAPKIMKVVGIVMIVIGMIGLCVIGTGSTAYISENYGLMGNNPSPTSSKPLVTNTSVFENQWNSTKTTADDAMDEAFDKIITYAELATTDTSYEDDLTELFTGEIQADPGFTGELTSFITNYKTVLKKDMIVWEGSVDTRQFSDLYGRVEKAEKLYRFETEDGEVWFLRLGINYSAEQNGRMGINQFIVEDLNHRARYKNEAEYEGGIMVLTETVQSYEHAVVIGGEAVMLSTYDDAKPISADDLKEQINNGVHTVSALKQAIGQPHATEVNEVSKVVSRYYELTPEDGTNVYAEVRAIEGQDEILGIYLYDKDKMLSDGILYDQDSSDQGK